MKLHIELEGEIFAPGERVAGRVHVAVGGRSRSLEVLLQFIEESPDYRSVTRSLSSGVLHSGDLDTGQLVDFSIELPADALPNAWSENAELYWELDARSEEPGRDTHAREAIEVVVAPRRT